ncbi:beta-lactamase [Stagonosporopsis vannaccii]|nr:beta-lactamase [Stagonosporopsis vannaccii]
MRTERSGDMDAERMLGHPPNASCNLRFLGKTCRAMIVRVRREDMAKFGDLLAQSTVRGSNIIPGCVLTAVNGSGVNFYRKKSGYHFLYKADWYYCCLAMCQRGQISLDEPVERVLPELANLDIIERSEEAELPHDHQFTLKPSTKKITLKHLLSHTSGLASDHHETLLGQWRASRLEPPLALTGKVIEAYAHDALSWTVLEALEALTCEIVKRLNKVSLEDYLEKHVFGPLGMTSTTFRLEKHPELSKRLVKMKKRTQSGILEESENLWPTTAPEDCGGAGLYSTGDDYAQVLNELLQDKPKILKPETVELMFSPQLEKGSPAIGDLHRSIMVEAMTGIADVDDGVNFGLGGLYIENDVGPCKGHSLIWGGLPNLYWFANRRDTLAGFYASQILPTMDPESVYIARQFLKDVFRAKQL